MDPSRNCNKVIRCSAFIPLGDGELLRLESGSAGGSPVESVVFPSSNHVVPPNARPLGNDPKNQPAEKWIEKEAIVRTVPMVADAEIIIEPPVGASAKAENSAPGDEPEAWPRHEPILRLTI